MFQATRAVGCGLCAGRLACCRLAWWACRCSPAYRGTGSAWLGTEKRS